MEGQDRAAVQNDLRTQYQTIKRRIQDHRGYLAEVYMAQILWSGQNKTLPGKFFHSKEDITLPWHFSYVKLRSRLGGGKGMKIDVEGGAGKERWICESKWWIGRKVGQAEVASLVQKGNAVKKEVGEGLRILRLWFFAHDGFTEDAEVLMLKNGVLWSVREDLDGLLESVGLRRLPNVDVNTRSEKPIV